MLERERERDRDRERERKREGKSMCVYPVGVSWKVCMGHKHTQGKNAEGKGKKMQTIYRCFLSIVGPCLIILASKKDVGLPS